MGSFQDTLGSLLLKHMKPERNATQTAFTGDMYIDWNGPVFWLQRTVAFQQVQASLIILLWTLETSLLRRLQAQTLPDATPPIGNIYPFTKMTITFELAMQL